MHYFFPFLAQYEWNYWFKNRILFRRECHIQYDQSYTDTIYFFYTIFFGRAFIGNNWTCYCFWKIKKFYEIFSQIMSRLSFSDPNSCPKMSEFKFEFSFFLLLNFKIRIYGLRNFLWFCKKNWRHRFIVQTAIDLINALKSIKSLVT